MTLNFKLDPFNHPFREGRHQLDFENKGPVVKLAIVRDIKCHIVTFVKFLTLSNSCGLIRFRLQNYLIRCFKKKHSVG